MSKARAEQCVARNGTRNVQVNLDVACAGRFLACEVLGLEGLVTRLATGLARPRLGHGPPCRHAPAVGNALVDACRVLCAVAMCAPFPGGNVPALVPLSHAHHLHPLGHAFLLLSSGLGRGAAGRMLGRLRWRWGRLDGARRRFGLWSRRRREAELGHLFQRRSRHKGQPALGARPRWLVDKAVPIQTFDKVAFLVGNGAWRGERNRFALRRVGSPTSGPLHTLVPSVAMHTLDLEACVCVVVASATRVSMFVPPPSPSV